MKFFFLKILALFFGITISLNTMYFLVDVNGITKGNIRYTKTRLVSSKDQYSEMIIGSSRVFDVGNIQDCASIYNYGIIQGLPADYPPFIEYAINNQPIEKVIVALDFYGSSTYGINNANSSWKPSQSYIDQVKSINPIVDELSIYSIQRFKRFINFYLRGNNPFTRNEVSRTVKNDSAFSLDHIDVYEDAYSKYQFNESWQDELEKIKKASEGKKLIVYITPVSRPQLELLLEMGLEAEYQNFLKSTVMTFDSTFNMMEINTLTHDPKNFLDVNHLEVGILKKTICSISSENWSELSGTLLDASNIDDYILTKKYLKKQ